MLGAAFATDDFNILTARLRAAGFPPGVIAEIARREVDAHYDLRINALLQLSPDTRFWKTSPDAIASSNRLGAQLARLNPEREKAYRDAVNDLFYFQDSALDIGQRRMWGNLPREKLDRIQRIEDDYAEMISTATSPWTRQRSRHERSGVHAQLKPQRAQRAIPRHCSAVRRSTQSFRRAESPTTPDTFALIARGVGLAQLPETPGSRGRPANPGEFRRLRWFHRMHLRPVPPRGRRAFLARSASARRRGPEADVDRPRRAR